MEALKKAPGEVVRLRHQHRSGGGLNLQKVKQFLVSQAVEQVLSKVCPRLGQQETLLVETRSALQLVEQEVKVLESDLLTLSQDKLPDLVRSSSGRVHRVATSTSTVCGWNWALCGAVPVLSACASKGELCKKCRP